jgi:hypothetical protein
MRAERKAMDIVGWLTSPVATATHVQVVQRLEDEKALVEAGTHVRDTSGHLVSVEEHYCDECGDKIRVEGRD